MCMCEYIYIYIHRERYIQRERDRQREREIHIHIYIYIYICIYRERDMYVYTHTYIYICVCIYIQLCLYIYIYIHVYIYIYIQLLVCVYTYMYIYGVYTQTHHKGTALPRAANEGDPSPNDSSLTKKPMLMLQTQNGIPHMQMCPLLVRSYPQRQGPFVCFSHSIYHSTAYYSILYYDILYYTLTYQIQRQDSFLASTLSSLFACASRSAFVAQGLRRAAYHIMLYYV